MKFSTSTILLAAMAITNAVALPLAANNFAAVKNVIQGRTIFNPRPDCDPEHPETCYGNKVKKDWGPGICDPLGVNCDNSPKVKAKRDQISD
ncbi:unnamed protein product [Zymoseptoria tritici ST99CH_3D1]|uniref:Uncharacterized protein n=1 Tax=Zymoseptoria tritici (strain ST99CH_3D7) TaxID=1276538 RepID=A0A1X7RYE9_ZYMT9|nr:unnamed protein product [Zymoseptoria tritici ST99CH_3D7]SMR57433.1 unnamed protein product [Zymoseptoria tritici ST99CH_3D1]